MKREEYVGKKFNHITIVGVSEKPRYLDYVCDCGKQGTVFLSDVRKRYSCGCMKRTGDANIGTRYGRLTVIGRAKGPQKYVCKCDCGNTTIVDSDNLRRGYCKSCGCLHNELAKERCLKRMAENPEIATKCVTAMKEKNIINGWNIGGALSTKLPKNNTSGVKGVSYHSRNHLWVAYINIRGKQHKLGSFANKEDAIAARKRAEEKRLLMIMEDTE